MENIFLKLGIVEPHTLAQIQTSIIEDIENETSFINILKEHHYFLEESIEVILDNSESIPNKRLHLERFLNLFEMHGKAEQETLYQYLQQNMEERARLQGLAGQDEHDIAFLIKDELIAMNYKTQWNDEIAAKAKVIATLIKNHMEEEESEVFSFAKKELSESEMNEMRDAYLDKCQSYLFH